MRVALIVVAMLLFAPAVARAGTYDVQLCTDPAAPGFVGTNSSPASLATVATCPPPESDPFGGAYVGVRVGMTAPGVNDSAAWTLAAPAGTTLDWIKFHYVFSKSTKPYEVVVVADEGTRVDGCEAGDTCTETNITRTCENIRG